MEDSINTQILSRLIEIKEAHHISNQDMADKTGMNPYTIREQMSGRRKLSLEMVALFVLLVPTLNVRWLITGDGDKYNQPLNEEIMPSLNTIQATLLRMETEQHLISKRIK